MSHKSITIKGAREHNLKDISLEIPRDKLVVITGLSGSGKSSLAFDTLYAEGQRRYVESLSSYARQFLGQMNKPDVDSIEGLSPAVSIDQKTTSRNPRSTVGTTTEIYDYLRLLYARVGTPHCPHCGREISSQSIDQVVESILALPEGLKALILAPLIQGRKGEFVKLLEDLRAQGFSRIRIDGEIYRFDSDLPKLDKNIKHTIELVLDRITIKPSSRSRIAAALELALVLNEGDIILVTDEGESEFSLALACPEHGFSLPVLEPRDFSFNAPYGACPECSGIGFCEEIDPKLLVPDPTRSVADGAISPFMSGNYYPQILRAVCLHCNEDPYTPFEDLSQECQDALLYGLGDTSVRVDYLTVDGRDTHWFIEWEGAIAAVRKRYSDSSSDKQREKFAQYFSVRPCPACKGQRLKPEILAVRVGGKSIYETCTMSARASFNFFESLTFSGTNQTIAEPIIKEIRARLKFLVDVGLDYLTLERPMATLSGGEAQRIRLATQIGSALVGVLYILDEPSIGLHQRDNERLIATLEHLRDIGNTVIVVEHDEETIRRADYLIDMGPRAGEHGGQVVFQGPPHKLSKKHSNSYTAQYLTGAQAISIPSTRREPRQDSNNRSITIYGVSEHNLQNVDVEIPLGMLSVVTGVSGSGKSSLITDTLAPALANRVNRAHKKTGEFTRIVGYGALDKVIDIDQSPIGRTPRSNPATYIGLWDDIRALFASTPEAKAKGYSPGRFSFNVAGGRCEACKGDGQIKIEMHFLPDIYVPCEVCSGKRYNQETLSVHYRDKSVYDILEMTADDALKFFENLPAIARKLQTLHDVGLGYIRLGQAATTLSGGEAQRIKLASELQRRQTGRTFYILDEPTTGLHMEDIRQLLEVLQRLVDAGNTVLVIEHNLDVIKCADHIIDIGPEGGSGGGRIVAQGTPEEVASVEDSHTGRFLRQLGL